MSEAAMEVIADAPHADADGDASSYPAQRMRFVAALIGRSRTASILRSSSPAFRILMLGSSVSMFGSRISTVAFPMLVLHLDNSPLITGLVAFAVITPSMLVYMPAGVLVDRWDPWRVMLVSEFLRGLVIASVVLSLAILGDRVSIPFLIAAMVAEEILEIFSTLADRRYLSRLMECDNMASRQAYVEVRAHAVVLAGRPLGPFLFAISPLYPFLADALSFFFSVGSLVVLRKRGGLARESQRVHPRQLIGDAGEGFKWLKKDRRALLTVILMAITSLVAQALVLIFLSDAHSKKLSTVAVGVVLAASGAGGALGSVCSRFLPDSIRGFWLPIQMVAWSAALAFLALAGGLSVFWSAGAMLTLGFTGAIGNIEFGTYLVSNVADDMIAKVTGFGQMLAIGAAALGPVIGGAAVQHYGPQGAIGILLVIAVLLLSMLTPELTEKSVHIYHSVSRGPLFSRLLSFRKREGANCPETRDEASAVTPGGPEQNRDTQDEAFGDGSGVLAARENGRLRSTTIGNALTWDNADGC